MPAPRQRKPAPKAECAYCYGHGIDAYFWDRGMRRPLAVKMPKAYACDRCGKPANYTPCPKR